MLYKILLASITLASLSSYADVDYSHCNFAAGMAGARIDNDGKLNLLPGQKIKFKSTEGNIEKYVIESTMFGNYIKYEVSLVKDDQGRVVKVISGSDKLDKKAVEEMKKLHLQMQLSGVVSSADFANGNTWNGNTFTQEPMYNVKNENGGTSFLKFSQLNQAQRSEIGLSEDVYKSMKQKWKKDKKTVAKIEKGLKELSDKSSPTYFLGQEAELEIKDGVCSPSKVSTRMFNSKDGSVQLIRTFSKEVCEEVAKIYLKHKDKLSKCDETNIEISQDTGGYPGMGFGNGFPGMGFGGLGYGSYGSNAISHLGIMKSQCDMMLGEISFGKGIPEPKEEESAASPQ